MVLWKIARLDVGAGAGVVGWFGGLWIDWAVVVVDRLEGVGDE